METGQGEASQADWGRPYIVEHRSLSTVSLLVRNASSGRKDLKGHSTSEILVK